MISISVLIITHGREELLTKCLSSLNPPVENWEIILVANGLPLSEEILAQAQKKTKAVTVINLEQQVPPGKARNLGLEAVTYEWIYFIDDDAFTTAFYWDLAIPMLESPKIDVLGGPDSRAAGMGYFSNSLAITLSSPFCTGVTFQRHSGTGKNLIETNEDKLTSCNLWVRKNVLGEVRFPEEYRRAEEILFLQQLRAAGVKLHYHPKLTVAHFRRKSLAGLFHPTFYAGFYRSRILRQKLTKGNEIFWLPSFFVLLHLLLFLQPFVFMALARLYAGMILFASMAFSSRAGRFWTFPAVALLHYLIVFIYGLGFLAERLGMKDGNNQTGL